MEGITVSYHDGIPWMKPDRSLVEYGPLRGGSSRTMDAYAERLLSFGRWVYQTHVVRRLTFGFGMVPLPIRWAL